MTTEIGYVGLAGWPSIATRPPRYNEQIWHGGCLKLAFWACHAFWLCNANGARIFYSRHVTHSTRVQLCLLMRERMLFYIFVFVSDYRYFLDFYIFLYIFYFYIFYRRPVTHTPLGLNLASRCVKGCVSRS